MKNIFILFFLLAPYCIFSQWNPSAAVNNSVCTQANKQDNPKMTSDLKGGAIIVWEDYRNDTAKADIYVQRISNSGNTLWTTDGVAICTDITAQSAPLITADSVGGAIIVWEDKRSGKKNLYAQRIDSSGNVLWTANGVGVNVSVNDQKNAKLLPDGIGGAIIIWQDSIVSSYGIFAQRLNSAGVAQWAGGATVAALPFSQSNPKAQLSLAGDIFVAWQDKRNGYDYDVYVQKLDLSGVAQWTANGINLTNIAGTQSNPKMALDNSGGAVIAWQDKRGGIDYDVFAQRINAAGAIQWTTNGLAISTSAGAQTAVDISSQFMTGDIVIAWKDARAGINNLDIYAQRLNLAGAVQWAANGLVVANGANNQVNPNVIGDGVGGCIIAYQDSSSGTWDIRSQRLDIFGVKQWPLSGVDIGIAPGTHQINHTNIGLANGSSVYAFTDLRSANRDIYAYKLDASGNAVGIIQLNGNTFNHRVYPNPSVGKVTFDLEGYGDKTTLSITDISGKEILTEEIINSNRFELTKKPEAGIYFYNLSNKNISCKGKLIILN